MTYIQSVRSVPAGGYNVNTPGRQTCAFFDRDGVFNAIDAHVNSVEQLDQALYPGAIQALAKLTRETDVKAVLVTNQGGIDAGMMSAETNQAIQEHLASLVEQAGGRFDAILYCPNGKKFQLPEGEISGRKPDAGMFIHAAQHFGDAIDLADSYMVGDMTTDIAAGEAADSRLTTILLKTGFKGEDGKVQVTPDRIENDIASAVDWIIGQEKSRTR